MNPRPVTKSGRALQDVRVGWIGAGKMGAPMIRNLLAHDITVAVTEPEEAGLAELVMAGATLAASLANQNSSDVVFSTLPHDQALLDVVLGTSRDKGLADTLPKGATFVEMSTVSPECSGKIALALAKTGIHYLRAPLSGSTALAEKAALTVLASGDEIAWSTALPYLEMLSSKRFYLGPDDEARYMKLVVNVLVGATSAILAEALSVGESGGLSRASMMEVICESAVTSPLLAYKKEAVVANNFEPAFTVLQMIKDFNLVSDVGRANSVPLPTTGLILELYKAASNAGLKSEDFFALVKWHSNMSTS